MQQLISWINEVQKNNITQHSDAWHNARKNTIGGSSIGTIIGINPYKSLYEYMIEQIQCSPQPTKISMNWGTLFEDTLKEYTESIYNCQIIGENIYIQYNDYISYSPDGLSVIDDNIVLFEFKCPYTRKPSNKVPPMYEAQVRMGLDIINIAKYGLIIQGFYKKSSLQELNKIEYLSAGLFGFYYIEDEAYYGDDIFDCSLLPDNELNEIISSTIGDRKKIGVWRQTFVGPPKKITDFINFCASNQLKPLGYLYWYLKHVDKHKILPIDKFLEPHLEKMKDIVNTIAAGRIPDNKFYYRSMCENLIEKYNDVE